MEWSNAALVRCAFGLLTLQLPTTTSVKHQDRGDQRKQKSGSIRDLIVNFPHSPGYIGCKVTVFETWVIPFIRGPMNFGVPLYHVTLYLLRKQ